jgi:hypothetical protein
MFYQKDVHDYYLGFIFPLPFLLVGFLLSQLNEKYKKFGKLAVTLIVILLFAINIKFTPISIPGNQQAAQVKMISDFIISKTHDEPYNFALMAIGNSDHAYRYFFKLRGEDPVIIENPAIDPNRYTATKQLFIVCEKTVPCNPLGYSLWEVAGFGRAQIADEWDVSYVKVFKLVPYEKSE